MNEIKFGTILENAARLAGRDPATLPIPSGWKVLAGMAIESGLHAIAAEKFPLMQRVEFRRYRPDYDPQAVYAYGQEVWFEGEYRRWMERDATCTALRTVRIRATIRIRRRSRDASCASLASRCRTTRLRECS